MLTNEIIKNYFNAINQGGWENWISDDMVFTSPRGLEPGKNAYIQATKRFFQVAKSVTIKEIIIDGDRCCVVANYSLLSPKGNTSVCEVAEILTVKDEKINSSSIFFDTKAFQDFMAQG